MLQQLVINSILKLERLERENKMNTITGVILIAAIIIIAIALIGAIVFGSFMAIDFILKNCFGFGLF